MNETVLQYLRELSPGTKARITAHFAAEVEEFSILVGTMIATLQQYHAVNPVYDSSDARHPAFGLMTKSANSLTAGFELALGGYLWEPPVLLRSALEGCTVAWDIVHNSDRFATWNSGRKFDATDSISKVKKVIEPVGRLYGFMSNMNVHTKPLNSSPSMLASESGPKFQLFGFTPPGKEIIRKGEIYFAMLVAHVCLQLTELVFHRYATELETIEKIPGTDLVKTRLSARHQRFVGLAMDHFKGQAEGAATCF